MERKTVFGPKRRHSAGEPGATLFARLRVNLTLWYTGVLAVALIIFGVGLYVTVSQVLEQPISTEVTNFAKGMGLDWQDSVAHACTAQDQQHGPGSRPAPSGAALYIACFDTTGSVIGTRSNFGTLTDAPSGFPDSSLVADAINNGTANHSVNSGNDSLYIAAFAVYDSTGTQVIGVMEIGRSIVDIENALLILRNALIVFGFITLAFAALGGLFLANRALVPTRVAFTRQQGFVANVSHELRTPLALLRADAEVLLQNKAQYPPEDADLLDDIVQETEHMTTLTTTMLTLARMDVGQTHLEQDVIDLSMITSTIARRVTALAQAKGIIVREIDSDPVMIVGDRQLVTQAALILVDNAIKYTPAGGTVTIRTEVAEGQGQIVVKDSGIGVADEQLEHLGERFYRTDSARSRDAGGAGLGLSLAFSIAAAHKGTLRLASTLGHGLTATLTLPMLMHKAKDRGQELGESSFRYVPDQPTKVL